MLLPRKWALGLGLLAAAPSLTVAGPLDVLRSRASNSEVAAQSPDRTNQQVAEEIGKAIGKARVVHKDVQIEFNNGVATIKGQVKTAAQRDKVTRSVSEVAGVDRVENKLELMEATARSESPVQHAAAAFPQTAASGVQSASHQAGPDQRVQQVNFEQNAAPLSNQVVAQHIADALTSAGLSGYDIEVRYKGGVASLVGSVESQEQVTRAHQATSSVAGVNQVLNRLSVKGGREAQPAPGYGPQSYAQQMPYGGPRQPMPPQAPPGYPIQQTAAHAPGAPAAQPMGPGHVQPAGHQMYNQPNVPQYAWPSYAQYDNSAAVTYPGSYDASAWPYIGPYYPYPQVPLGWRKSTLEWDDGYWSLKFDSKTDRWWWFLNPHNWH